jgi:hypothetical protein
MERYFRNGRTGDRAHDEADPYRDAAAGLGTLERYGHRLPQRFSR